MTYCFMSDWLWKPKLLCLHKMFVCKHLKRHGRSKTYWHVEQFGLCEWLFSKYVSIFSWKKEVKIYASPTYLSIVCWSLNFLFEYKNQNDSWKVVTVVCGIQFTPCKHCIKKRFRKNLYTFLNPQPQLYPPTPSLPTQQQHQTFFVPRLLFYIPRLLEKLVTALVLVTWKALFK